MTRKVTVHDSIAEIGQPDWDACANPWPGRVRDPFTSYRFLAALENSGSVGKGSGWHPRHLALREGDQIIAVAPVYAKGHSQGEYVFDHSWAQAFERAGGRYYPKLQVAVPFTPVTGRRLLTRDPEGDGRADLLAALAQLTENNRLSSAHVTFCTGDELPGAAEQGYLHRIAEQFQWENPGYADFEAFLAQLSSRKRKNIRKERSIAQGFGGDILQLTGAALTDAHWDAFWTFYQDTGSRKWGQPYLTRAFFSEVQQNMRDDVLLVLAQRDGRYVAGALNFIGAQTLYGRYWGCTEQHDAMHFELCYYQAIDYAIAHGLRVEAGAQGEHKLARGYLPKVTHSLHWISDPGFRSAVADFLAREAEAVSEEVEVLTAYGPFRKSGGDDE